VKDLVGQIDSKKKKKKKKDSFRESMMSMMRKRFMSVATKSRKRKVTILDVKKKYEAGEPLSMVTAYSAMSGALVDSSDVDMLLVGDSVAMVMLGHADTTAVTMDEMLMCACAVKRSSSRCFLIGDMPFGSYALRDDALLNAHEFIKAGMEAVKLEGGAHVAPLVRAITGAGIPVVGHCGLTPQTASSVGGFRVQGRDFDDARRIMDDARALEEAGAVAIVLECIPDALAALITERARVPTIGIGAGAGTSGQVLVFHDMVGLYEGFKPKFAKRYAECGATIRDALNQFHGDVAQRRFPAAEHCFAMEPSVLEALRRVDENAAVERRCVLGHRSDDERRQPPLDVAVVGGGALGSLLGAKLSLAADDRRVRVTMVSGFEQHVQAIDTQGLVVVDGDGTRRVASSLRVRRRVGDMAVPGQRDVDVGDHGADIVLVAVKNSNAADTERAAMVADQLAKRDGGSLILSVQNGLGQLERIETRCLSSSSRHVGAAVTRMGAQLLAPGIVKCTGIGATDVAMPSLLLDPAQQRVGALISSLAASLSAAGMPANIVDAASFDSVVWRKLLVNCVINPLSALYRVTNGELLAVADRSLVDAIVAEVLAVAEAHGIRNMPSHAEALQLIESVAANTNANRSSMLVDIERGAPTEIDSINGAIVRLGSAHQVQTPRNEQIVDAIRQMAIRV
jgi:3-methyl-2-oxobutanoate hydroxymethyltransferase